MWSWAAPRASVEEPSEYTPGEEYHIDDHIKVYVLEVNRTGREMLHGPQVSRQPHSIPDW